MSAPDSPAGIGDYLLIDVARRLEAALLQHDAEQRLVLLVALRVEEREVLFGTTLPLEIDRQQVGPAT